MQAEAGEDMARGPGEGTSAAGTSKVPLQDVVQDVVKDLESEPGVAQKLLRAR